MAYTIFVLSQTLMIIQRREDIRVIDYRTRLVITYSIFGIIPFYASIKLL